MNRQGKDMVLKQLCVGEALHGEGNEVAHIDLLIGPRGSPAETAFINGLTNNKEGFTSLLAVLAPNLPCKPHTVIYNKVAIRGARQAEKMFGPAQFAIARAIMDSVAEGRVPKEQAGDLFVSVGVFIHWNASDNGLILKNNYEATRQALRRALDGYPDIDTLLERRPGVTNPYGEL